MLSAPFFHMLQISRLTLSSPFILAPLAGYSDLPFRLLCREFGAGLCVSEMISCHGLVYQQKNTLKMLASIPTERPVSFQLFGADPEAMGEASRLLQEFQPDLIDVNMGCPVKKVTKKGAGAALMGDMARARQIVSAVVRNSNIPVTAKIRSGKNAGSIVADEYGRMLEGEGVAAITVHARTWAQGFSGSIDPSVIRSVKTSVKIPVIGNGDVLSVADGLAMMEETGCDGVMIGRGALGNPWVFQPEGRPRDLEKIKHVARRHLELIELYLPAENILGYVKNHICRYFREVPGSAYMRKAVFETRDLQELRELISS